jgi:hypothetical protein
MVRNRVNTGIVWSAPSADTSCFLPRVNIDAFKLYMEVGEMANGEKLKINQLTKSIAQMDEKIPKLKLEEQQRAAAREEEVKRKEEVEAKRKQAQSSKRSRAPSKGPPAKKIRKGNDANGENKKTMYINKRVAKAFEGRVGESEIFYGTIDKITNAKEPYYWHITYDDDDEEEFDEQDITKALKLYQTHRADDPKFGEMTRAPVAVAAVPVASVAVASVAVASVAVAPVAVAPVKAAPVAVAPVKAAPVTVAAAPKPVEASAATEGKQDSMEVDKATPAPPASVVELTPEAGQDPPTYTVRVGKNGDVSTGYT